MALSRLGDLIQIIDERNSSDCDFPFYGINIDKEFMPSVANTTNLDRKKYKVIRKYRFVYSGMQTGRDNCIRIGLFLDKNPVLVSPAYTTFEVSSPRLLPEYLFMYFNSKEKDRYGAFLSDSSVRSNLDWDRFCDIVLEIPSIEIQRKYVAVYEGLLANLHSYERGLDDLKLVCDGYIEDLRKKTGSVQIGPYLQRTNVKNSDGLISKVMGLSTLKMFREANSRVNRKELLGYKILESDDFAYVPTTDTWKVLAFAYNECGEKIVVSPIYETFSVNQKMILPDYLAMWLKRSEFDRYARFNSWGSARENFLFEDMEQVRIPIPNLDIQRSISNVFKALDKRIEIVTKLKEDISIICPVLIRGSIEESKGGSL